MSRVEEFRQVGNDPGNKYWQNSRFTYQNPEGGGAVVGMEHERAEFNEHREGHDEAGNPLLFDARPASTTIDLAFATENSRHVIPSMIGMAIQHAQRRWGQTPQATHDLSPHSARLVQHFVDRGLTKNPSTDVSSTVRPANNHGFNDSEGHVMVALGDAVTAGHVVPPAQVAMGRQFIRDALRKPREQFTKTPVGEQLALWKGKGGEAV